MKKVFNSYDEELEKEGIEANLKLRREVKKKRKEAIRLKRLAKQYTP
jgi:hypothetical protein